MKSIKPLNGEWFLVDIDTFNMHLFVEKREDIDQEVARQRILQAIEKVQSTNSPKKFQTKVPLKTWNGFLSKDQLSIILNKSNERVASETVQFLEWGQRLSNGESWEDLCNNPDDNNYLRVISVGKGDYFMVVGGTKKHHYPKEHEFFNFGYMMPASTLYCAKSVGVPIDCVPLLYKIL